MMFVRSRCSTTTVTAAMSPAMTRMAPTSSFVRSETNTGPAITDPSAGPLEPHLPEWDVRVAEAADLHTLDVGLEETLVRVVPEGDHRGVLEDHLLGPAVNLYPARHVRLGPGLLEEDIHRRIRVAHVVPGAAGVEHLRQEVLRVRDIREPGPEEDR